ncbi:alpha/beta hydrolase [Flavobacterium gilvum]|uniref:Alpha/beta hydrolase n=1 Tax=Flavobacterium gilvum TaxID=1492737 RepID=A0AAC9N6U3_9FLAO|nr:alpha/beta hydrolase [Flavobacterium gilvum]AOW10094.1 alpha/beta hydrolase [Flavobacterium gilvum]KFC58369.1 beta-galactosidase [Flavobacterium gilvum]
MERTAVSNKIEKNISSVLENNELKLWSKIPNSIEAEGYIERTIIDEDYNVSIIQKVKEPTLKCFLTNNKGVKNAGVIICPGGAYSHLSHEEEGDKVAKWLQSIGISAFVLKYRLPSDAIMKDKTIGPLQDAQEAIRTLRRNAEDWNLDTSRIGIFGFSAGGHLAATLSTHYDDKVYESKDNISARPDFSILIYPVISMKDGITHRGSKENLLGVNASVELIEKYSNEKQVNEITPKTFLVHSTDDKDVPVENSINYYLALKQNKIPVEMHLYENGGHGYGLGTSGTNTNWADACEKWMIANGLIF